MSQLRDAMIAALKRVVVPALRGRGFSGSFPHLRRARPLGIDLLTFQFDRHGGGFVIEIARCSPAGFTTHWGKHIPPKEVKAGDIHPDHRPRLQPDVAPRTDFWFRFDADGIEETAASVMPLLEVAERWYASAKPIGSPAAG